jgi:hypothetical protein
MDQRVETIMHLAMNTQKTVFKLVLQWASSMEKGKEMKNPNPNHEGMPLG